MNKARINGTKALLTIVRYESFEDGEYIWVKERKCAIPIKSVVIIKNKSLCVK